MRKPHARILTVAAAIALLGGLSACDNKQSAGSNDNEALAQYRANPKFADRIVGLANGRLVFDGQPGQLDEAALQHIYHTPSANEPAQAMAAPRPMLATGTGASA